MEKRQWNKFFLLIALFIFAGCFSISEYVPIDRKQSFATLRIYAESSGLCGTRDACSSGSCMLGDEYTTIAVTPNFQLGPNQRVRLKSVFFNQELRTYQWNCQFRQENGGYLSKGWLKECLIGGQLISGSFRVGLAAQVEELSPIGALIHTDDVIITYKEGVFFPPNQQIPCR